MILILTRHGETVENSMKLIQGQSEGHLSEKGLHQAERLAKRLEGEKIDFIYSSDQERARITAEIVARFHPGLKIELDTRLRERNFGKLEGASYDINFDWNNLPDFVETYDHICERVIDFLADIYKKHKDETVLVVTHGGVIRSFYAVINGMPFPDAKSVKTPKNTSVYVFEICESGIHKTHLENCIRHLD